MKYLIIALTLSLTGCATAPQWLANHYDSLDQCQSQNNGGNYPSYCGAGKRTTIYATKHGQPLGTPVGYVQSR